MDPAEKNYYEVVIAGEVVTLTASESEDYIHKLARYLDKKIVAINRMNNSFAANSFYKTLLISINIADDFFKEKTKSQQLENHVVACEHELSELRTENNALIEQLREMQEDLANARNELGEYIDAFDKQDKQAANVYQFKK